MHRAAIAFTCAAALAVPAAAGAQSTAPPGNAGIDEYVETVPAAGGSRKPRERGTGAGAGGNALPAEARRALEAQGADGAALAEAIEATGPRTAKPSGAGAGAGASSGADAAAPALRDSSGSPLSAVIEATGGSGPGGLGTLLPIILAATLALMIAAALARRRTAR